MVQQNASLVEEATAATESMKEQAGSLLQMVSRFKLGADDAAFDTLRQPAPASAPAPAWIAGPQPIRVRASVRPVPQPVADKLAGSSAHHTNGNGEWKEF